MTHREVNMSTEIINAIKKDRLLATKNSDEKLKTTLGVLLGEIDRNRGVKELDDTLAIKVAEKMVGSIRENIAKYGADPIESQREIDVIIKYIPVRVFLSEEQTTELIKSTMDAGTMKLGDVMKSFGDRVDIDKKMASSIAMKLGAVTR